MKRSLAFLWASIVLSISLAACGDDDAVGGFDAGPDAGTGVADGGSDDGGSDDGGPDDAGAGMDGAAGMDASSEMDASAGMDAAADDAGADDGGLGPDADLGLDAGLGLDADLGLDGAAGDGGEGDASTGDAAPPDGGPPPGGCFSNADCPMDEWCAYAGSTSMMYSCTAAGTCQARPELCAAVFNPVCGCDGTTYSNACYAQAAGVRVAMRGACP